MLGTPAGVPSQGYPKFPLNFRLLQGDPTYTKPSQPHFQMGKVRGSLVPLTSQVAVEQVPDTPPKNNMKMDNSNHLKMYLL